MQLSAHRVEFFSDSIISIAITLLAFEMKMPRLQGNPPASQWEFLIALFPTGFIYLLTFVMLGISWAGHHELLLKVTHIDLRLIWLNMILLFWLTLLPNTAYVVGKYPGLTLPLAAYGSNMFMLSVSFILCRGHIIKNHMLGPTAAKANSTAYRMARNKHRRSFMGLGIYVLSIFFAFFYRPLALVCFTIPALLYAVPGNISVAKSFNPMPAFIRRNHLESKKAAAHPKRKRIKLPAARTKENVFSRS